MAKDDYNFVPADLEEEIDELNELIYQTVNNGVYRAGFAIRQQPYERAAQKLFETLDELDRLAEDPSRIGRRGASTAPTYDFIRRSGGATVYVFLALDYDLARRHVEVLNVGHFVRPGPPIAP